MNCEGIVDLLSAYIDDELAAEERRHVASHLDDCPDCRAQLAALKTTIAMVNGIDELDVPADVASALRQIAKDESADIKPAKRWLLIPKLRYLVATGAVAAIALVSVLSLIDTGTLSDKASVEQTQSKPEQYGSIENHSYSAKDGEALIGGGAPNGISPATKGEESTGGTLNDGEVKDAAQTQKGNESLSRSLSASSDEPWPMVLASKKDYDAASAEALLGDIHKKTDGVYSVKDASDKRAQIIDALVEKATAEGGEGELLRSPVNALLDRTKRAALPVYLEKAKFKGQDCLLIIIKWGFGDDKSDLYRTSLYVTDLSGWNVIHYASR